MNDAEREALVERMLDAFHATKPLSLQSCIRAALAVAEPVLREDEREARCKIVDASSPWRSDLQPRIIAAIRARGAA